MSATTRELNTSNGAMDLDEATLRAAIDSGKPVLVDFHADWCPPCRAMAPTLEQVARDTAGRAIVGKVNVDEHGDLAGSFGVQSIPTIVVLRGGRETQRFVGVTSAADLHRALSEEGRR